MNKNYHEIQSIYGKDAAESAYKKDQQDLARIDRDKNNSETMKALAVGMSVVSAIGLSGKAYQHLRHNHAPTPTEKHHDLKGSFSSSNPGNGAIRTEKGNFHVTQTTESHGGIGTAVAAEKQGDHFVEVDPITLAKK